MIANIVLDGLGTGHDLKPWLVTEGFGQQPLNVTQARPIYLWASAVTTLALPASWDTTFSLGASK